MKTNRINLYPITWVPKNDKKELKRVWFWQFWNIDKKYLFTIIATAIITAFLCYGYYLDFLRISHCNFCSKEIKGNHPFCSKQCYEIWLKSPEGQALSYRENEIPDPTGRGVH